MSSTVGLLLASGLVLNWLMGHGYKPELGLQQIRQGRQGDQLRQYPDVGRIRPELHRTAA